MNFRKGNLWKSRACVWYHLALAIPCIYSTISVIKKLQHNFLKMRWGGRRSYEFFPKIHPIWRSHPSLKIKSLQTSKKALQTWSKIKSKGANWCSKQRCECILHHFALPHGLLQGNCEKARSEYIYCKANCILIELQKSWNPPEVPSSINLAASQGSTSPSFFGNKNIPRSTNDPNITL